ncbi:MAG: BON domain-containing protein [Armatimonadetes bacterium]|nr:BON domain-containing protein [Armatimonadota bacterium]
MPRFPEPEIEPAAAPDHALIGTVRHALAESAEINTKDLLVSAAKGVVHLTGAVRTLHEKRAAGRLARAAPGAAGVENDLVVVPDRQPTDDEICEAVGRALGDYPDVDPARIGVRMVQDGTPYLAGKASSAMEAWKAADIAARVPGVKSIVSEIEVAPGEPVDDVALRNLVVDALSEDPRVDPFAIEICVDDADVYLGGEVEDEDAKLAAGELASGAPGVKRVINELDVRRE